MRFWEVKMELLRASNRILALKFTIVSLVYMLINVFLNCDNNTVESFLDYQSGLADLLNLYNSEVTDELIIKKTLMLIQRRVDFSNY